MVLDRCADIWTPAVAGMFGRTLVYMHACALWSFFPFKASTRNACVISEALSLQTELYAFCFTLQLSGELYLRRDTVTSIASEGSVQYPELS